MKPMEKLKPYLKEGMLGLCIFSCLIGIIWVFFRTFSIVGVIDRFSAGVPAGPEIIHLLQDIQDLLVLSSGLILLLAFSLAFCLWYFINRQIKIIRASALIRKSHERYRFFTEGPPSIGIVRFDLIDFRIRDANRAALRLFDMSRAEITGKRLTSLLAPEDRKTLLQTMADLQSGKRNAETVVKLNDDISENTFVSWHISSLKVPDSEPEAIAIVLDVTHKMKAREERLEKERLAGVLEMAGATAHELNQPLQVVSGIAWMMLRKLNKNDPNYEKVEKIFKEVERMSDIAKKISAISSYKVKKYVGKTRIIDIDRAASSPERNNHSSS